jgi:hypothetical protein
MNGQMEKPDRKNVPLIIITSPLIVYEIAFGIFVIYYIQQGSTWFKVSSLAIAVAATTTFVKILIGYRKWNSSVNDKKKHILILVVSFLFFALYLFCLLVQLNQGRVKIAPPLFLIPLLAVPPFVSFAMLLYADTRHSAISREDQ